MIAYFVCLMDYFAVQKLYLSIRPERIKYIEESIGSKLMELGLTEVFVKFTPKAREVKTKTNNWKYIKTKKTLTFLLCFREHF